MKVVPTELPDAVVIEPQVFGDARGFFLETWSSRRFAELGLHLNFVQDNWSRSKRGILRGLHFQLRHPQGKLVRVTQGEVFDVAVDLRRGSPTFGKWTGVTLSAENFRAFYIPPGFAHGFYVVSESADFQYKCTDLYAPDFERTLAWNDPAIGIRWPLASGAEPQLSDKDRTKGLRLDELLARGEVFP
jgi:dTDP-4-dehydrorhamnose 3,5-epimerase